MENSFTVGIVGLGLIGGSLAKAYKRYGHKVYAFNRSPKVLERAIGEGVVNGELTKERLAECDLVLVCVYPAATLKYLEENGQYFGSKPIVMDCCGTKRVVVDDALKIAEKYGFTYVGGHPMAGRQFSGYEYSFESMYDGAPMVIVPKDLSDEALIARVKELLAPAGFGRYSVTTASKHDRMIAFTSQLAHVVSNAYVKSPTALEHKGFSAGSYRDLTRVAWLNPDMWTELFFDNRDYLVDEIDTIVEELKKYRQALAEDNREEMRRLLQEGKDRKEEIDG